MRGVAMDNRAQGLPITTIILAILGLVVLVILFAITTGRLAFFSRGVSECPGTCYYTQSPADNPKVPASARATPCDASLEKALIGNYIASGQDPKLSPDKLYKCQQCCVSIA